MAASSLLELLDQRLAAHDVSFADDEHIAPVDPDVMRRVWSAFREMAVLPTDGLRPGLRVPLPGQSDLDGVSCDRALGQERDLAINRIGHPPYVSLTRRLYLVDDNDEWQDWEVTGLQIYLASEPFTRNGSFLGAGGPPADGVDGVAAWVDTVEGRTWWPTLFTDGAVLRIRRW